MEILVCVKRVPDTSENEIQVNGKGTDIERDDLVYSVNEWDNYAVEEAIQIRDRVGGSVTVMTVGDDESEEVLRREMAMGADTGILLSDDAFEAADGRGIASILKAAVAKGKYDLILTGAQADDGAGQVGGMLAAMLDVSYASLVNVIEVVERQEDQGGTGDRRRQPGDERDGPALRALDPDGHQRAPLRGHPGHPEGRFGGDPNPGRGRPGPRRRRRRSQGQAPRLLRAGYGRGCRDADRQHRGNHRETDGTLESQRRD